MSRRLAPETKTERYMVNANGMVAQIVSRRVGRVSLDLFGFVDVVGFKPRNLSKHEAVGAGAAPWLCVQATTSDNSLARRRKILGVPENRARAFALMASGHRVEVWGWLRGRSRDREAFRRFELCGRWLRDLDWRDAGIVEVAPELLVEP